MKIKYLLLSLMLIVPYTVNASEIYFSNNNGVQLNEKEYDYIIKRFSKNFVNVMTQKDYENLINDELLNSTINIKENNMIMPIYEFHETSSKAIKISSACTSSYCSISVVAEWYKLPTVRSYDVIGAFFINTSLLNPPTTYSYSTTNTITDGALLNQTNGFGVSIKIPSGKNVEVVQYYNTKPNGVIYASYQHAKSSISLTNSKKYTISNAGYGGVFLFDKSVKDIYDAMGGVDIEL